MKSIQFEAADAFTGPVVTALIVMFICGVIGGLISRWLPKRLQRPVIGIAVLLGLFGYMKIHY